MAYTVETYTLRSGEEVAVVTHGFQTEIVHPVTLLPELSVSHRVHYVLDVRIEGGILSFLKGGDPTGQRYGLRLKA